MFLLFVPLILVLQPSVSSLPVYALYDGFLYELSSNFDDKVLTVRNSSGAKDGQVAMQRWESLRSQKWLAVGVEAENTFLLLPLEQDLGWEQFRSRENLANFLYLLPPSAIVLNHAKISNSVDLQIADNRSFQQWTPQKIAGRDAYLLKNVGSGLCLKNPALPNRPPQNLTTTIGKVWVSKEVRNEEEDDTVYPEMADCDEDDVRQQWVFTILKLISTSLLI